MMLMRYARKKGTHDRVRSRLSDGLINDETRRSLFTYQSKQDLVAWQRVLPAIRDWVSFQTANL